MSKPASLCTRSFLVIFFISWKPCHTLVSVALEKRVFTINPRWNELSCISTSDKVKAAVTMETTQVEKIYRHSSSPQCFIKLCRLFLLFVLVSCFNWLWKVLYNSNFKPIRRGSTAQRAQIIEQEPWRFIFKSSNDLQSKRTGFEAKKLKQKEWKQTRHLILYKQDGSHLTCLTEACSSIRTE